MAEKVLIIYANKETNEYDRFEIYELNQNITKEKIVTVLGEYNVNDKNKTVGKIYEDKLLIDLCSDVYGTRRFNGFIDEMRDICKDLEDAARRFSYEAEELQDYLKENYPTESDNEN